jgi:molybdopterin synthase sulfur carrier subunit
LRHGRQSDVTTYQARVRRVNVNQVIVRYFAGAAEAAGVETEALRADSVGALIAAMVGAHGPGLQKVLTRCSLLADGVYLPDDVTPLADGVTVDVLPPFAGG